jgi:hypothetical protein
MKSCACSRKGICRFLQNSWRKVPATSGADAPATLTEITWLLIETNRSYS